jgi:hypothetical protein
MLRTRVAHRFGRAFIAINARSPPWTTLPAALRSAADPLLTAPESVRTSGATSALLAKHGIHRSRGCIATGSGNAADDPPRRGHAAWNEHELGFVSDLPGNARMFVAVYNNFLIGADG